MVEKVSIENIAAQHDASNNNLNIMLTTKIEDKDDCPKGYQINEREKVCEGKG